MAVKVLFCASECVPFVKTGGLADVIGALPKYITKNDFDVRVILPKYKIISEKYTSKMNFVQKFYIDHCGHQCYVGLFETEYEGIKFYFVDNEDYFSGEWAYTDMRYDLEKFTYFSKAVLAALPALGFQPDIIHCHDWQTGIVPLYVKCRKDIDPFYANVRTIMTVHNLKFQGVWDIPTIQYLTALSDDFFTSDKVEAYGDGNLLKAGLVYADVISTVSPSYAIEIRDPYYGEGLDGLMRARHESLVGILNGIDTEVWNPMTDPEIYKNFSRDTFDIKAENKAALQKELGLSVDPDAMVIGMVSRLTEQKGFELVLQEADALCEGNTQLVILGSGDERYTEMFRSLAERYPDRVSVTLAYSEELSHKIYASADALLMPSRYEPCGLCQMMAMRYGTLPIVRETGGLKDTVEPYNEYRDRGCGFSFLRYAADDMIHIVNYAKRIFREDRPAWKRMSIRAMDKDYSWAASAARYEDLYNKMMGEN